MLSQEAYQNLLGIRERVPLAPLEMADKLNVTFFPHVGNDASKGSIAFGNRLKKVLKDLKANIVPYDKALEHISLQKALSRGVKALANNVLYGVDLLVKKESPRHFFPLAVFKNILFKRDRVKKGISIISIGEQKTGSLPMDYTLSFRESSVITIVDVPPHINEKSEFSEHFETAMGLFAHHMTNIILAIDKKSWLLYNFNASHPRYPLYDDFKEHILNALIPKIVAPIRPLRFSDFNVTTGAFDVGEEKYAHAVSQLKDSGVLFERAGVYPQGKTINSLPFRNNFYRWIGRLHLDQRNGMSYGFLAWQLPVKIEKLLSVEDFSAHYHYDKKVFLEKDYFQQDKQNTFLLIHLPSGDFVLRVPEVWVMTQRSGSNKTQINPAQDIIKLGLVNGQLYLHTPTGARIDEGYKPSFDTQVILAHALGNAIIASILSTFPDIFGKASFVESIEKFGFGIAHWHGYIHSEKIPPGWYAHGASNPHVSCSSPQSAVYAIEGKLRVFLGAMNEKTQYKGDIHIEPHHGTNITFTSLTDLANLFLNEKDFVSLGNKYLSLYYKEGKNSL